MSPALLRLPFWLVSEGFRLERAIARDGRWDREDISLAYARLALSGPERRFATTLLRRKRNLWLWRCHPAARCGDFAVVDLSSPDPALRVGWLLELKESSPWRGGRGLQLGNPSRAHRELQERGRIGPGAALQTAESSTDAALAALL